MRDDPVTQPPWLAAAMLLLVLAVGPREARAQYGAPQFCPAYMPTVALPWTVRKSLGAGTVVFRDFRNYYLTLNLGVNYKYFPPSPQPRAFQDGTQWIWSGAAVDFAGCVMQTVGSVSYLVVVLPVADPLSRAVPIYAPDDPDGGGYGDGGSGDGGNCGGGGGDTQLKASNEYVFSPEEVVSLSISCGGGDGSTPGEGGGSSQCLIPGCYDVYIDGLYAGSFCIDSRLCIRT